ncbi:MAG: taurine catabolism dioxygenase, partial [Solirubrobacterales bacterium]|nr:taurine catabolism dioxygenase [Solirubrobacterales bacterium]
MSLDHVVIDPVGVEVRGLAAGALDAAAAEELKDLLAEHGVLILRGQHLDDEGFVAFLRRFGLLAFTQGEAPVDGAPDLNLVSNVGRTSPPRSQWHVDTSYVRVPPAYTALRAVEIPEQGGETLFTNQYRALETLPAALRERLDGRSIRHVMTGLSLGEDDETAAEHPVFRPHPRTGRPALY